MSCIPPGTANQTLGAQLQEQLLTKFDALQSDHFAADAQGIGARRLKNLCLSWLVSADPEQHSPLAAEQYRRANNMSDFAGSFALRGGHRSAAARGAAR